VLVLVEHAHDDGRAARHRPVAGLIGTADGACSAEVAAQRFASAVACSAAALRSIATSGDAARDFARPHCALLPELPGQGARVLVGESPLVDA